MKKPASTVLLVVGALVAAICAAGALGALFTITSAGPNKQLTGALLAAGGGVVFGVGLIVLSRGLKMPAIITGVAAALVIVLGIVIIDNKPAPAVSHTSTTSVAEESAADDSATSDASAVEADESKEKDADSAASKADSKPESAPYPAVTYSDEELEAIEEEQDAFAHDLLMESVQKLVDEGAIRSIDGNGLFPFDGPLGKDERSLRFEDESRGKALANGWPEEGSLDGVIVAEAYFREMYGERTESCDVCDKYGTFGNHRNEFLDYVPRFYPSECHNHTAFGLDENSLEKCDIFADSLDECKYLILYGGFESLLEEDFYFQGDRVTISTLVILIDAQSREIVAIKDLGSDTPPAFKAEKGFGDVKDTEARQFVADVLWG